MNSNTLREQSPPESLSWFPFFPKDWLLEETVRLMSHAGRGMCIDLLSQQWAVGSLPTESEALRTHLRVTHRALWNTQWRFLQTFFPVCEDGRRRNPQLEQVRAEQHLKREKRVTAGTQGGHKKASNALAMLQQSSSNALPTDQNRSDQRERVNL